MIADLRAEGPSGAAYTFTAGDVLFVFACVTLLALIIGGIVAASRKDNEQ